MSVASPSPAAGRSTAVLIAIGVLSLAVAMGIGRFAFTPLMPLMMRDGVLTAAVGAEWAAANYGGYFIGALTASMFSTRLRRGLLLGLFGVAAVTLAGAVVDGHPSALPGAILRGAAGVFSAWSLICASGLCLAGLARRGVEGLAAWIFTGVGLGVAFAGVLTWLGGRQPAAWLWAELGTIAAAIAVVVALLSRRHGEDPAPLPGRIETSGSSHARSGSAWLTLCYSVLGIGYIVPATFLPAMARELAPDPLVFGLAWPLFGLAAFLSVAMVARWLKKQSRRRIWAACHGLMAIGTALPVLSKTVWAIAISAMLVGGSFVVVTVAAMQLAREIRPDDPTPLLARMTSGFAAGQIAGPVMVRMIGDARWGGWDAMSIVSALATLALAASAAWLLRED